MKLRLSIVLLLTMTIVSCSNSLNLSVAFAQASSLEKGIKVYAADKQIGSVKDIKPNKNLDTLIVILRITKNTKIPTGSIFYIDEGLVGSPKISVEYSKNKTMLTSEDISIGIFRPIK